MLLMVLGTDAVDEATGTDQGAGVSKLNLPHKQVHKINYTFSKTQSLTM